MRVPFALLIYFALSFTQAQEREDRLVRLIRAESAKSYQNEQHNVRLVSGNAQFLHNGALIICDSAIWNLESNIVDAKGNVKIIQEGNTLTGDQITYIADSSLAKVRGYMVELTDKEQNKLRTHYLDYNTKDSVAYFFNGGSMMDTTGSVIESLRGYYDSKISRFKFLEQVAMRAEGMILYSDSLAYWSEKEFTEFLGSVTGWQEEGFLTANRGWYTRNEENYSFYGDVYLKNNTIESWGDSLVYNKIRKEAQFWKNVQVLDTTQSLLLFSDYALFKNEPTSALLYNNPSVAQYSLNDGVADTLFFRSDTIKYRTFAIEQIDSATMAAAKKRYESSLKDPMRELYSKKREPEALEQSTKATTPKADSTQIDSTLSLKIDSTLSNNRLSENKFSLEKSDSVTVIADSLNNEESPPYRFLEALNNIKVFRSDLQGKCDSLQFNSIDSIIRLYKNPVLWNAESQFSADSIFLVTSNQKLKRADFSSNSFVASKVDSLHYNQVKSSDMIAWFNDGELIRFDAFGGISRIVFIDEDSLITTMNLLECKAMSATFVNEEVEIVRSYEGVKNDAFPVIDLKPEEKELKGFKLRLGERPKDRNEVCDRRVRESMRKEKEKIAQPRFGFTYTLFKIEVLPPPKEEEKEKTEVCSDEKAKERLEEKSEVISEEKTSLE